MSVRSVIKGIRKWLYWNGAPLAFVLIMASLFCILIGFAISESDAEDRWLQSEHTCPVCGWTGYPGDMKMIVEGGLFGDTMFFCPECAAFLYEI